MRVSDIDNQRAAAVTPFHVMRLLARARELESQGRSIVHMEIGEPDFPTPDTILLAAQRAIATGDMYYTPASGLPALRERIAAYYQQQFDVNLSPQRIVITPGASGALLLALAAVLDVGEEVLLADPGYPCNRNITHFLGAAARAIATTASTQYQLTSEQIRQHWSDKTRAVLLATPANPTGMMIDNVTLQEMAEVVAEKQGVMLVDEIYQGLVYGLPSQTVLSVTDSAFVMNSFSKYFGMTGWRVGWIVVPESYQDVIDRFAQNVFLAAPTPSQYAALAAFDLETIQILEQRRLEFQQRRDYLLPALQQLGFGIPIVPQGAFYIYASCERFTQNSMAFCEQLLEEAGVAITPGIDFGAYRATTHVRFAYTTSITKLQEGVERIKQYLQIRHN